jgi:hypothetical protein
MIRSSPNDPLFWSLHATIDREFYFYQYVNFTRQDWVFGEVDPFFGVDEIYNFSDPEVPGPDEVPLQTAALCFACRQVTV